ncbi:MAG: sialate O-acetylesterase [Niastella sp.]|uniref:sialate O-acetylesterase n=1 Tax=Niastella sp. TaxID=1869183 RepID=UPI00389AD106
MIRKYVYTACVSILMLLFVTRVEKTHAAITLPAIITDSMVLQQRSAAALWGWAKAGEKIEITNDWDHRKVKTIADKNGTWQVRIKTGIAGGPYTITIRGENTITIKDVYLGEVWLCSGQSNMNFPLGKGESWRTGVFNCEAEIAKANYTTIRLFTVKQEVANEPQKDVKGKWNSCTSSVAAGFSAVAYYFAREIQKETGFPIGLIHSSWGGTPAESWTRKDTLQGNHALLPILQGYEEAIKKFPADEKAYAVELEKWKRGLDSITQQGGKATPMPKKPVDPLTDSKSPSTLYNAMIHPLIPFTIKGVIWYQGESNSDRPCEYQKLFPALINSWRKEWNTDFPFYFVEIAPHYQKIPEIREAQLYTYKTVSRTGLVVITDYGDSLNIHPRNKEVVGHRLALWALAKDYGKKEIVYSGPIYRSMNIEGNKVVIHFDYADGGLVAKEGTLKEFAIAGSDKQFMKANATIEGDKVIVWSDMVKQPEAVRFGWRNFPHAELYNKAGLPASPFSTGGLMAYPCQ